MDPITLQVMSGGLRAACEEMGATLIRSPHSANIKERRDCSTALFDAAGEMVMQAEHIPVHLGSMPEAVAAVLDRDHGRETPGSSTIPTRGGTHLPDITLISPGLRRRCAASASPPAAPITPTSAGRHLAGCPPTPPAWRRRASSSLRPGPTRRRCASWRRGCARRDSGSPTCEPSSPPTGSARRGSPSWQSATASAELRAGMAATLDYAERRTRAALAALPDGAYEAADVLENDFGGLAQDLSLRVRATIAGENLSLDFGGTDPQVEGNLNCPLPVTSSAALFAVRALIDPDAPPSAGAYRPIEVIAPPGCLLNALPPAAVAAGNVETSSRIADLTIAALGGALPVPAQGQGTMNNLTLAGEGFTYYETLGGGQGACPEADGPSAIHVTMSNTLNTPVEALETELPLRVRELSVRRGSGGAGLQRGGDGIAREIEALAPMRFTLIAERRRHAPRGREGGADGAPGRDLLGGEPLPSKAEGRLEQGDVLRIETPGGGGYGRQATFMKV